MFFLQNSIVFARYFVLKERLQNHKKKYFLHHSYETSIDQLQNCKQQIKIETIFASQSMIESIFESLRSECNFFLLKIFCDLKLNCFDLQKIFVFIFCFKKNESFFRWQIVQTHYCEVFKISRLVINDLTNSNLSVLYHFVKVGDCNFRKNVCFIV